MNLQFHLLRQHKSVPESYMDIVKTRSYAMVNGFNYNDGPSITLGSSEKNPTETAADPAPETPPETAPETAAESVPDTAAENAEVVLPQEKENTIEEEVDALFDNHEAEGNDDADRNVNEDEIEEDFSCSILQRESRLSLSRQKKNRKDAASKDRSRSPLKTTAPPPPPPPPPPPKTSTGNPQALTPTEVAFKKNSELLQNLEEKLASMVSSIIMRRV